MTDVISNFDHAVTAYKAHCELVGHEFQQPSEDLSQVLGGLLYLRAAQGYVARYSIKKKRLVR